MKKLFGILATILLTTVGCSIPGLSHSNPSPQSGPNAALYQCALLGNEGLSSYTAVKGSFDCLSKGIQSYLTSVGVTDDASLAQYTQGYTEFTVQSCNVYYKPDATHYAFLFLATSVVAADGTKIPGMFVNLDLIYVSTKTGKVDGFQEAGQNPNFDVPLTKNPTCTTLVKWPKPQYID